MLVQEQLTDDCRGWQLQLSPAVKHEWSKSFSAVVLFGHCSEPICPFCGVPAGAAMIMAVLSPSVMKLFVRTGRCGLSAEMSASEIPRAVNPFVFVNRMLRTVLFKWSCTGVVKTY